MRKGRRQRLDAQLKSECMGKKRVGYSSGLTVKQYLIIGGFALIVFGVSVWTALFLGDVFADYIGPVY